MLTFVNVIQILLILITSTTLSKYSSTRFDLALISVFCGIFDQELGMYLKYPAIYVYLPLKYFYYENESKYDSLKEYFLMILMIVPFLLCFSFATLNLIVQVISLLMVPIAHAKGLCFLIAWVLHLPIPLNYSSQVYTMIKLLSGNIDKLNFQILYLKKFQDVTPSGLKIKQEKLDSKRSKLFDHVRSISTLKENSLFLASLLSISFALLYSVVYRLSSSFRLFGLGHLPNYSFHIDQVVVMFGSSHLLKDIFLLEPLFTLKFHKRLRKRGLSTNLKNEGAFLFNVALVTLTSFTYEITSLWLHSLYHMYYIVVMILCLVFM
eukprot:NODE_57_length_28844_cov_0.352687.p10 type:complete len:322 gc:universal NODE_57_length_28844_cov_0.352687:27506-28471(+)